MKSRKIAIASDHAGFYLKEKIVKYLIKEQHEVKDFGCSSEETVDYTDFAHPMAYAVSAGEYELGVSICGTGNGLNITVNKHPGVRSALCWNEEVSRLSRAHNDANILVVGNRHEISFFILCDMLEKSRRFNYCTTQMTYFKKKTT